MVDSVVNSDLFNLFERINNYNYLIPELRPTKQLYRYRANTDFAIDEIQNSYIFLTPIEDLNDPYDSSYFISFDNAKKKKEKGKIFYDRCLFISRAPWYKDLKNTMEVSGIYDNYISMEEFFCFLEKEIKHNGSIYSMQEMMEMYFEEVYSTVQHNYGYSASFSERYDNTLMWAYYADSHKGLCLAYDTKRLDPTVAEQKALIESLRKVWYSSERYEDSEGKYTPFVKAQEWSHEQEWRLFNKTNKGKIHFPCLQAVYLGMNFDVQSEALDRIISAIKSNPFDISLYACRPDITSYKIKPMRILI